MTTHSYLFLDIDGCLSNGRGSKFDLHSMTLLKAKLKTGGLHLVLSSGRSQPYIEAVSQMLSIDTSYICENGAAIYDPGEGRYIYRVAASVEMSKIKKQLDKVDDYELLFEPGKEFSISLRLSQDGAHVGIENEFLLVKSWLANFLTQHQVTHSSSAVDIVPRNVNKANAVKHLLERSSSTKAKTYAFGDSHNDLGMMSQVNFSGAPSNATEEIKAIADFVSKHSDVGGLLDFVNAISD